MKSLKKFYLIISSLKTKKRQGWLLKGMKSDVIASHTFGAMSIGYYLAKEQRADENKVLKMLLVHDWVMAKMEDVTPRSSKYANKRSMEDGARKVVYKFLPQTLQKDYLNLFDEYNQSKTLESKIAREADKIETLLQGETFEESTGNKKVLDGFFDPYEKVFKTKLGKQIFEELKKRDFKRNK